MGGRGIRILNWLMSHDQNEWQNRLEGLNGLLLLLVSMFVCIQHCIYDKQSDRLKIVKWVECGDGEGAGCRQITCDN